MVFADLTTGTNAMTIITTWLDTGDLEAAISAGRQFHANNPNAGWFINSIYYATGHHYPAVSDNDDAAERVHDIPEAGMARTPNL